MFQKAFARQLRANATDAERKLWYYLRARRLAGFKFRRQVAVGPYVVDFLCVETCLVIEVDGGQHADDKRAYDMQRDRVLRSRGYRVYRFWNHDVLQQTEAVLTAILAALEEPETTRS